MEKTIKYMKHKGMISPFKKNYQCQPCRSIANIIYWKGSNLITNTFFLLKKINCLRQVACWL